MNNENIERETAVLFSTKDIGTERNLFCNKSLREWFRSPKLCDFFLSDRSFINPNIKAKILKDIGIQDSCLNSKASFLERYKDIIPTSDINDIKTIKDTIDLIGTEECKKEFEEIWNNSVSEAEEFVKKIQEIEYVNNSPHEVDEKPYHERFSIYTLQPNNCWVYAVKSLSKKAKDADIWYRVLCHEIVERHKDCKKLDLYLVLHDKDIYDKATFKVIKTNETYEKSDNTDIRFNVIVFQHQIGEDPIADILNTPSLTQEDVIKDIINIAKIGPLSRLSNEMSTYAPNIDVFFKNRSEFPNLQNAKIAELETIKLIDDELKSILKIKDDE